jgi:signal transduction histidine kinase
MHGEGVRQNRLLHLLNAAACADLAPLTPIRLTARQLLKEPGMPAIHAYFPVTAVVSLVSTMESGASTEIALIGREGMIGLAGVFGTVETSTSAVVQIAGDAIQVSTAALRTVRLSNPSVRRTLDRYTQARLVQIAQTAACSRLHSVEARLARWLLAIHDRIEGDEFVVSQEFIAGMLGVHRPTVSTALQRLEEQGATARRGRAIVVIDRPALEARSCECRRVIDREFDRLLTPRANGPEPLLRATAPSVSSPPDSEAGLEAMHEIAGRLLLVSIREQEAREQAEEANRAKDQFLATVSHELRNPLNIILGWCAALAAQKDRPMAQGLEVISRSARAQLKLIDELLDAARVTSSTLTIQPVRVSLRDIAADVVEAIQPAANEKQVSVEVVAAEALPPVFADPDRLPQILLNVLTNSLKFTDAGGSIDIHISRTADRVLIVVRDTGRGIAPSVLPHVFDAFRQGATDSTRQGLGLGLTITRALVELHGGTISLDSPGENQGTTCTIAFPLFENRHRAGSVGLPVRH